MGSGLIVFSSLIAALVVFGCTYRNSGGADERNELRDYLSQARRIETKLTDALGVTIAKYPAVYDENVERRSSATDVGRAYRGYFSEALPHVETARAEWARITPPSTASGFHTQERKYLDDLARFMRRSVIELESGNTAAFADLLPESEQLEKDEDQLRAWFGKLLDESR